MKVAALCAIVVTVIGNQCSQPLLRGSCFSLIPRYGYDQTKTKCVQFFYSGCGGNTNNFETKEDCQEMCESDDPGLMPPLDESFFRRDPVGSVENICTLPIQRGRCLAHKLRYAFDSDFGRCVPFSYGGCGGNSNRFETLLSCEVACARYTRN
ncbi:Kunitz/Bovine pancreatic trypsin inhibitor domain protein [Necator americanus]|uniref:Kunitz/Bovine pancreatic trypsin inhibitor domain protein n=1 Tax=Necator americanus TaxID=51031 RepID=W2T336_NECAM|nr:Kunitz/Bovine pancreatic trypsin inhibitor domain protein [Necator americanus]ETN75387.1 Kunitz/Bovine pancreatic trypsin inhibitor domain protein [Necator americanus]